jgi:hypothetical protein
MLCKSEKRQEFEALLRPIIENYLPTSAEFGFKFEPTRSDPEPRSARYALRIKMGELSGPNQFGQTDATVTLEQLRRSLETSKGLLDQIAGGHSMELSGKIAPSVRLTQDDENASQFANNLLEQQMANHDHAFRNGTKRRRISPHEVSKQLRGMVAISSDEAMLLPVLLTGQAGVELLASLLKQTSIALREMEKSHGIEVKATKKANWKAAAIAGRCRLIWAMEHFQTNSEKWQKFLDDGGSKQDQFQREWHFAPKTEHHDAPGIFGRFLNDILDALCIVGKSGQPVSAAVALRQWKSAEEQRRDSSKQQTGK